MVAQILTSAEEAAAGPSWVLSSAKSNPTALATRHGSSF